MLHDQRWSRRRLPLAGTAGMPQGRRTVVISLQHSL